MLSTRTIWRNFLHTLVARPGRSQRRHGRLRQARYHASAPAVVERLEDRVLLSTIAHFDNQSALPSNMATVGTAQHLDFANTNNHIIQLTAPANSQLGSLLVDGPGHAVLSFQAVFDIGLKDSTSSAPGDGMSFGYGPLSGGAFGEDGERHRGGLWVSIDTFDNGAEFENGAEAPGLSAWYGNTLLFQVPTPFAIGYDGLRGSWNRLGIDVSGSGVVRVQYLNSRTDGAGGPYDTIVDYAVQIPNWNPWAPQDHWDFGVGARTGLANDFHVIESFRIDERTSSSGPTVTTVPLGTSTTYGPLAAPSITKEGAGTAVYDNINTGSLAVNEGTAIFPPGVHAIATETSVAEDATLFVDGELETSLDLEGTLGGNGRIDGSVSAGSLAIVIPGSSPGRLSTGSITFQSGSQLRVELDGGSAGSGYDQLNVRGAVNLGGATLRPSLGFTPSLGQSFTIVNNDSTDRVVGTFAGLSEGEAFNIGGKRFHVSYRGGTGNDVVLTRNRAPVGSNRTVRVSEDRAVSGSVARSDADRDGTTVRLVGAGPANEASFALNASGTFSYRPKAHWSGTDRFQYRVSDGELTSGTYTATITVDPVADAPTLSVSSPGGTENTPIPLSVSAGLVDADGSESITAIRISGVPANAVLNKGTKGADGAWTLRTDQLSGLTITVADDASLNLTVTATTREGTSGPTASTTKPVRVAVANVAPTITGLTVDPDVDENGVVTLVGRFDDPGSEDSHEVVIDWGDGGRDTVILTGGERSFTRTHRYLDDDPSGTPRDESLIRVSISDDEKFRLGYDGFADTTGLTLSGHAAPTATADGTVLRLARAQTWSAGSAFSTSQIDAAAGFSTQFAFRITNPGGIFDRSGQNGADGFTFTLQTQTNSPNTAGGGLGYEGIAPSVAVEFDTYHNWFDPSTNHVGVNVNGSVRSVATADLLDPALRFDNGDLYYAWIDYDDATKTLEVRLSKTDERPTVAVLSHAVDIPAVLGQNQAFVGFTAATGGAYGNHDIVSWQFADTFVDTDTETVTTTVHNVAPTLALDPVVAINENGTATLTGMIGDPGTRDTHTTTIAWGDGAQTTLYSGLGSHYLVVTERMTWEQAEALAVSMGGHLAAINSQAENDLVGDVIRRAFGNRSVWIGLSDAAQEGSFVWSNGDPVTYTNWANGQPDDWRGTEDYAVFRAWAQGNWNDLSPTANRFAVIELDGPSFTLTHQYLDDDPTGTPSDTYAIGVTLTDDDGGVGSAATSVTVRNVAPTVAGLTLDAPAIDENGTVTLTGNVADPGSADTHRVVIDWGDGSQSTMLSGLSSHYVVFDGMMSWTEAEAAAQALGGHLVAINSQAENDLVQQLVFDTFGRNAGAWIGISDAAHEGTFVWSNGDPVTYTNWQGNEPSNLAGGQHYGWMNYLTAGKWDDHFHRPRAGVVGAVVEFNSPTFRVQHQYRDDNPTATPSDTYTISVTATDDDGEVGQAGTSVTVNNVAPTVALDAVAAIDENGTAVLTGSFTDIGLLDAHTVVIGWDDPNAPAASTFALSTTNALAVGQTFASTSDGAVLTVTAVDLATGMVGFRVSHQYLDDGPAPGNGTSSDDDTITVTIADDDTGAETARAVVTVSNRNPEITEIASSSPGYGGVAEGEPVTISGRLFDVGTLDRHSAVIDWGDDTEPTEAVISESGGSGAFSGSHTYARGGIFTITVTLTDDDLGTVTATATAVVTGVGVNRGVLYVIGTNGDDHVTINRRGNGQFMIHADFLPDRGKHRTVSADGVQQIVVMLGDGNDHATIAGNVTSTTLIDGGAGDDHLNGGGGPNLIWGGDGDDRLIGGNGRDILIGGRGADRIVANGGEDILLAGWTTYDPNSHALNEDFAAPLRDILNEWNSDQPFSARVANIQTGEGLTDGARLDATTVRNDAAPDKLTGSAGRDWFLADADDDQNTDFQALDEVFTDTADFPLM